MSKVLVIGLDGATFDIIRPLVADGRLPNLGHIMQHGAWGTLKSTVPPLTPAAWTTFFTGKNAGKHGIFDFQKINPETYEIHTVRTDQHREKTLWELLGDAGRQAIITDVPFTYPPRPLNGWMITGYGTPRTAGTIFTHPTDLAQHLPAALRSEVKVALPTNRFERSQYFIEEWQAVMDGRRRLLRYLITERPWDLFMHVFSITDNMAHVFWTYIDPAHPNYYKREGAIYREAFLHGYEMCDQILGELMELAGPETTTIILSDHGFGSIRPHQYLFQRLLKGEYLKVKGASTPRAFLRRFIVNAYQQFPILREWAKGLQPKNRRLIKKSLHRTELMPNAKGINYASSQVIPTNAGLRLWIHEQGRFAQGIVPPAQKEVLMDELEAYLTSHEDEIMKQPIIGRTYRSRDLYHGPFAAQGADLIIEYHNMYNPGAANHPENPFLEGGHTPNGIFLAYGPQIQSTRLESAHLIDLAPTILHLFDERVPPDMDGRVLTDIFTPAYQAATPVQFGTEPARHATAQASGDYSEPEEAKIKEQLRQLGYID